MASGKRRSGIFATHRGRKVRNIILACFTFSLMLVVFNGLVSGGPPDGPDTTAVASGGLGGQPLAVRAPVVKAAIADAFNPQALADQAGVGSSNADAYQAVTEVALTTAASYGTYSYQQTPEQFVAAIPNLASGVSDRLLKQAVTAWPNLTKDRVVVTAGASRTAPSVISYRDKEGTARVVVTISQTVNRGTEKPISRTQSYFVDLTRPSTDGGTPTGGDTTTWSVSGIVSA